MGKAVVGKGKEAGMNQQHATPTVTGKKAVRSPITGRRARHNGR